MNDAMSAGLHRGWKSRLLSTLQPAAGGHYLDVAAGTGDVGIRIMRTLGAQHAARSRVTLADPNGPMLEVGKERLAGENSAWVDSSVIRTTAEDLSAIPDASVDGYTIAFGMRNVTDIDAACAEAARVLKPGGAMLCLEFGPSLPEHPVLDKVYEWYSFNVIPPLGELIAGEADPYQYLVESIRRFPQPAILGAKMERAGLTDVSWEPLTFGVVNIHSGFKPL